MSWLFFLTFCISIGISGIYLNTTKFLTYKLCCFSKLLELSFRPTTVSGLALAKDLFYLLTKAKKFVWWYASAAENTYLITN